MPEFSLYFLYEPSRAAIEASELGEAEMRRQFYKEHGLQWEQSRGKISMAPGNEAQIKALRESLDRHRRDRLGDASPKYFVVFHELSAEEAEQCEWFVMYSSSAPDGTIHTDGYPRCTAWRLPPGRHVLQSYHPLVSEQFRQAVEDHELTGLAFIWAADTGKYRPHLQWYLPVATAPLGHGIDHRLFDRKRLGLTHGRFYRAVDPTLRYGRRWVHRACGEYEPSEVRPDWPEILECYEAVASLISPRTVEPEFANNYACFLRRALPATDFAYFWNAERDDDLPRYRTLCVSRRARSALEAAGLLGGVEFLPVLVLDEVPKGRLDLDEGGDYPPPALTPEEIAAFRIQEQERQTRYATKELPARKPNLKRALAGLRAEKRARPDDFEKGARAKRVASLESDLGVRLPERWKKVLAVTGGGTFSWEDPDCVIIALEEVPAFHRVAMENWIDHNPDFPQTRLFVGHTANGDYYVLDLAGPDPSDDAPILLLDHETDEVARRWEGVADFMETVVFGT